MAYNINASPTLTHLAGDVLLASFCPEGFVGIGVPIGTDAFVQNFVAKTCRAIIDDVEKLDSIQDGFIHYHLLRFCQTTRLQYINFHILLGNQHRDSSLFSLPLHPLTWTKTIFRCVEQRRKKKRDTVYQVSVQVCLS